MQPTQPAPEVVELRRLVDRLEKELADQQQKFPTFVSEQPSPTNGRAPAPPGKTPAPIAALLGLARQWPKVTALVTAVLALGSGYGGVSSCRDVESPAAPVAAVAESSPPAVEPAPPKPPAIAKDVASTELDEREEKVSRRESEVSIREMDVTAGKTDLVAKERRLKAREDEMTAQGRAAATAQPRMGFFDFRVPKVRGRITLAEDDVRGSWPSRDCVIVAVTPLDVDEVPASFPSSCTNDGIMLEKPKGVPDGRRVRIVWQLNGTAGRR